MLTSLKRSLSASLFLSGFVVSACNQPCVLNTQCDAQQVCYEGACLKQCTSYYSCAQGEACVEGACQAPPEGFCERQAQRMSSSEEPVEPLCEPLITDASLDMMPEGAEMGVDMGADMGGVEAGTTSGVEAGTTSGVEAGATSGVEAGATSGVEAGATSGVEAGATSGVEAGATSGVEAGVTSGVESGATSGTESGVEAGTEVSGAEAGASGGTEMTLANTPWLYTQGAAIYQSASGGGAPRRWIGRGVNLHDTRSCDACTWIAPNVAEMKRRANEAIDVWGATLVRLNLESYPSANGRLQSLGLLDDSAYLRDVEELVRHIGTKEGVYVMISPWREPLLSDEGWPTAESEAILRALVQSFYRYPHVIFAVSHEPRANLDGAQDASCWAAMNSAVSAIREEEALLGENRHLVAVQGTRDLGRDLSYYLEHPITAGEGVNILYETHIFNSQSELARLLVAPAQSLPVVVGAFGPSEASNREMSQMDAGALITEAERQLVSWVAWTFHSACQPASLLNDTAEGSCGVNMPLQPSAWGQLVQERLVGP